MMFIDIFRHNMVRKLTKMKLPLPLSADSTDELYQSWLSFVEKSESGSVYYHNKSDLLYRINQLQNNQLLKQKYLKNTQLIFIDAESSNLEDPESWDHALNQINPKTKTLVCIAGLDIYLMRGDAWVFNYLMQKGIEMENSTFILFFTIDLLHPQFVQLFDKASTWIQRVIRIQLHTTKDTSVYLTHQALMWNMILSEKHRLLIETETAGGYFLFPKEALRYLRDNPQATDLEIINHREMEMRIQVVWRQLLPSEQSVMKKVVMGLPIIDPVEQHSLEFLTDTGWINKIHGKLQLAIPLIIKYIQNNTPHLNLDISLDGHIKLNEVPIDAQFSRVERSLMKLLIQNKGVLISRDQIAEIVGEGNEEYNDWAIDKAISRLRRKLTQLDIPSTLIKTVHGKGFVINY
jgi:hypothetical protein